MKYSIIVPVYNAEKTIGRCLESIRHQKMDDFECILVNDGSLDNSLKICKHYESIDKRFKVINQTNSGVSSARNTGILEAIGEWITFVDADDAIGTNYFSVLVSISIEADLIVYGFNNRSIPEKVCNTCEFIELLGKNVSLLKTVWNKVFRKSVILNNRLSFDTNIHLGEDYLFVLRYLQMIHRPVACVNSSIYFHDIEFSILSRKHYPIKKILEIEKSIINSIENLHIGIESEKILLTDRRKTIMMSVYYSDKLEPYSERKKIFEFINSRLPFPPISFYWWADFIGMLKYVGKKLKIGSVIRYFRKCIS